jgi:hypothetical protein
MGDDGFNSILFILRLLCLFVAIKSRFQVYRPRHVGFVCQPVGQDAQLIGGDSALLNAVE